MKEVIQIKGKIYERGDLIMERYGISISTLYRLTRDGVLPSPVKLGRKSYYNLQDVEDRLAASAL
jgi:predicted DNA-binding transcriptional regulator AlpA